jgi:hypothetical protein
MQNASPSAAAWSGEPRQAAGIAADVPLTLDQVVAGLRRLAVAALDAGFPVPAAQIASTADRVEVEASRVLPPRPGYPGR